VSAGQGEVLFVFALFVGVAHLLLLCIIAVHLAGRR